MSADRPAPEPLTAFRHWVFNEFGITGEGAWTEEFDRLLAATLDAARATPAPALREAGLRRIVGRYIVATTRRDRDAQQLEYEALYDYMVASAPGADPDTEPCPTCWQPVPVPQRGDHDYGIPLAPGRIAARLASEVERGTGETL